MTDARYGSYSTVRSKPDSPAEMPSEDWKATLGSARRHMKTDRVSLVAGSLAYRWFLALFPTLIALLGVAALVHLSPRTVTSLIHGVTKALPAGAAGVVTGALSNATKRTAGALPATALAAAIALWSASSGMVVLEIGLDLAYEVPRDRKFLNKRLVALALMIVTAVLGGAASGMVVFGAQIGGTLQGAIPIGSGLFTVVWTVVRWLLALVLITVLFAAFYFIAPNRETRHWRWVSPGAIFATVVWAAATLAFSFYTSSFGSYGKTYGAFAGVVILILWLYITGLAVLLGGEVNAAFERVANRAGQSSTTPEAQRVEDPRPNK
jgi:membrane protein